MTRKEAEIFLLQDAELEDQELALRVFRARLELGETVTAAAIEASRAVIARLTGEAADA